MKNENKQIGKVYYFNKERGFGFLRTEIGREEYFFHVHDITVGLKEEIENLEKGTELMFMPSTNSKGLTAIDITIL